MSNSPSNDPTKLEYWLFDYDERYVRGESPIEYATRMRAQYLRSQQLIDAGAAHESVPEPPHEDVPSLDTAQDRHVSRNREGYLKERRKVSWVVPGLLCFLVGVILYLLLDKS